LGEYKGPLQQAVVQMKHEAGQPLAAALGTVLATRLQQVEPGDPPDLATCIPKYWAKRLLTGVNSAEILMSAYGVHAQLPVAPEALFCRRNINKQSMLSPDQRRKNVRSAWALSQTYDLRDAHILLVDDIMTTGATASEAARALKRGGARRVTVGVVARALSRGR
jgi:ComF family protein